MPSCPQIDHLKAGIGASIHVPSLGRLTDPIWTLSHVAVAETPASVGYDPRPRCAWSLIHALTCQPMLAAANFKVLAAYAAREGLLDREERGTISK